MCRCIKELSFERYEIASLVKQNNPNKLKQPGNKFHTFFYKTAGVLAKGN